LTEKALLDKLTWRNSKASRTRKAIAESDLSIQTRSLKELKQIAERCREKGTFTRRHAIILARVKAALRLLESKEAKEVYLQAEVAKLRRGLSSANASIGFMPVIEAIDILRERHCFRTFGQAVDSILRSRKARKEFAGIVEGVTSFGPDQKRQEQTKLACAIALKRKNPLIIDVGVSLGRPTEAMAQALKRKSLKARFIASDLLVRKKAIERLGRQGIKLLEADITKTGVIPRGQPKADLVIANRVLRYMLKKQQTNAILNMLKDLKVGGYLYLSTRLFKKVSAGKVEHVSIYELFKRAHL